jgi:hypothetical protein
MFRSLLQNHLQGSSFALSAPTTLQLPASSFVFVGMWSYALYLLVCSVYLPVCCLVVQSFRDSSDRPKLEDTTNPTHGDWRLFVQN